MDASLRFELAALLGMALANLSLEQQLDPLRERIPAIQKWLLQENTPSPALDVWLDELKKKLDPLPSEILPGGDQAAAILYYANAKTPPSNLKTYLYYLAHFINRVTFSKDI